MKSEPAPEPFEFLSPQQIWEIFLNMMRELGLTSLADASGRLIVKPAQDASNKLTNALKFW